jgi:hypothetical protein
MFQASELQTSMIETMEAVEIEKQRHHSTRMEALACLARLEVISLSTNDPHPTFTSLSNALKEDFRRLQTVSLQSHLPGNNGIWKFKYVFFFLPLRVLCF